MHHSLGCLFSFIDDVIISANSLIDFLNPIPDAFIRNQVRFMLETVLRAIIHILKTKSGLFVDSRVFGSILSLVDNIRH